MHPRILRAIGLVVSCALCPLEVSATHADDLNILVEHIRRLHPDPFGRQSEAAFETAVAELRQRVDSLTPAEAVIEFQRLVARLEDGHSSVQLESIGAPFGPRYPVWIYPFDDGLHVAGAATAYADIVGGRVTRIGDLATDDAIARVGEVISGENEFTILDRLPRRLTLPPLLHALGVTSSPIELSIEVEHADGSTARATIAPMERGFDAIGPNVVGSGFVSARADEPPLQFRHPERHYWFEHLEDEQLLYVQFNHVKNQEDESLGDFFRRVLAFADEAEIEVFVLDLRYNHGGNNQLLKPLIHGLIRRTDTINQRGRLFALIGRGTFSAAVSCTAWLKEHTNVRFVGEPAGSAPNHFGDAALIALPTSGARVWISEWAWQTRLPWDDRPWFAPHHPAPSTFEDFVEGRDAALETARHVSRAPSVRDLVRDAVLAGGPEVAADVLAEHRRAHPERWGVSAEADVNRAGYDLLRDGHVDHAISVFQLNVDAYPGSANAWDSLAEGHLRAGRRDDAVRLYERAIAIDPEFENARRMLAELSGTAHRTH